MNWLLVLGGLFLGSCLGFMAGKELADSYRRWWREAEEKATRLPMEANLRAEKAEREARNLMEAIQALIHEYGEISTDGFSSGSCVINFECRVTKVDLAWCHGRSDGKEYFSMGKCSEPTPYGQSMKSTTRLIVSSRDQCDFERGRKVLAAQKSDVEAEKLTAAGI